MKLLPTCRMQGAGTSMCLLAALLAALLATAMPALAQSPPPSPSRGQVLYQTHCSECHSAQMHWRQKKQVRDWPGLIAQVRYWQTQAALNWTDEDVGQVATYLNATYYRLPPPTDGKLAAR